MIGEVLKQNLHKLHTRRTMDFLEPFEQKVELHYQCTDLELQCEGYSLFKPAKVFQNFITYFQKIERDVNVGKRTINSIKVTLNGFTVESDYIRRISNIIKKLTLNLKTLWINTNDLDNVTLEDFGMLFRLIKIGVNNPNFEDFSLQCANWTFQKRQPTLTELMSIFQPLMAENQNINEIGTQLLQKHVRLEISGWWYRAAEAKMFLGFLPDQADLKFIENKKQQYYGSGDNFSKEQFNKQVPVFHSTMHVIISRMLEIMKQIQHLEIDMRNNHELLQMKKLKEKIITGVSKVNRIERSIISMRYSNPKQDKNQDKPLRLNIMM